jgi:ABC-type glycerol-3-phosphate transport system substrate-binding protein
MTLVSCLLLAGCRAPKPGPPGRPPPRWQSVTIRIGCPDFAPVRRLLQTHGRTWARDNGATLSLVPADAAADAIVVSPPELPTWAAAGKLLPLPDGSITAGFLPLYRSRLLNWDNRSYALPLLGDGIICVFRDDLYGEAATRAAYKEKHGVVLSPPATWDEFAQHAEFFSQRRGRPSLPSLPADDAGFDRQFGVVAAPFAVRAVTGSLRSTSGAADASRAAAFSFQYDAVTGEPTIGDHGFVEAVKLLQTLSPHRSAKPHAVESLRSDEAVLAIVTLDELAALRPADGAASTMRWGVVRGPGSGRVFAPGAAPEGFVNVVPYVGSAGALGAVPKDSACPDAAFELLTYLCSDSIGQEVVHDPALGSGPYRDAQLSKEQAGWFAFGLDEENTTHLREVLRETADPRLDNPALALRIPNQAKHRSILVAAVRRAIAEKADPAPLLKEVARQWDQLDGDRNRARLMFRKSLGL